MPYDSNGVYSLPQTFGTGTALDTLFPPAVGSSLDDIAVALTTLKLRENIQSADYTLVAADAGKFIFHPSADVTARAWTINSNANVPYIIGTQLMFVNQNAAGTVTLIVTADTMRLAGSGATGTRTLAANGIATALKVTSTEWLVSGTGIT